MIDYTHIPLHIRCTDRHLIDPTYPRDDARWWRIEETKRDINGPQRGQGGSELQRRLMAVLSDREATRRELADALGGRYVDMDRLCNSVSRDAAIYEYRRDDGQIVYGALTGDLNEGESLS